MGLLDALTGAGPIKKLTNEAIRRGKERQTQRAQDVKGSQETALEKQQTEARTSLETALRGRTRGLQAAQGGQRSQLFAQLQRLGIRGASQARQARGFEAQAQQGLAANQFGGQLQIMQFLEQLRNQRVGEIAQQDHARRQMIAQQAGQLRTGALGGIQQGEAAIGSLFGAAGTAVGGALGGPIGAGIGSSIGGLFGGGSTPPPLPAAPAPNFAPQSDIPFFLQRPGS